jgi:hypothetical protein
VVSSAWGCVMSGVTAVSRRWLFAEPLVLVGTLIDHLEVVCLSVLARRGSSTHARTDDVGSLSGRAMAREGPLTEEVSVNDFK